MTGPDRGGRPVTIRDVAKLAGVSVTTVSHAFSGRRHVRPETRERIATAAADLGYRPNPSAQSLRLGRTRTLALLLAGAPIGVDADIYLGADFYVTLANVAARTAFDRDYALLLMPPLDAHADLGARAIDGAIVVDPVRNDPRVAGLEDAGVPTVTIERDLGRPRDPWWVGPDNGANARLALDHLAEAGAARVAFLTAEVDAGWAIENEEAYRAWCRDRRQRPIVASVALDDMVPNTGRAMDKLLDRAQPPDGLFAVAELIGPAALAAARRHGVAVPDQLRVVAGVDSNAARVSTPSLTAIDSRPDAQAAAAVELLLARLGGLRPRRQAIPGRLQVRASSLPNGGDV